MTTDEETNFSTLVTSPSATSFNLNFDHDKDLPTLNCDDLFPNPPKYIPDTDQLSNHAFNSVGLECETFAGFSDDTNTSKTSPGFLSAIDNNDTMLSLNQIGEESSYSNSHDLFETNGENQSEGDNTRNSTKSMLTSYEQSAEMYDEQDEVEEIDGEKGSESKTDSIDRKNHCTSVPMEVEQQIHTKDTNVENHSDMVVKMEDKNLLRPGISLPACSPSLSHSSYYSSAESVSSETSSKKKKKRHCHTCNVHFKHTRDLLKHLRMHVSMPSIFVSKLCESDAMYKDYLQRQKECTKEPETVEHSGGLKLKLKLSGSQNFEVVPIDKKKSPPPSVEEKPKKASGIRILKAQEIKLSPPHSTTVRPIDAMTAMSQMPIQKSENSIENRYFECPTFDGLDQFVEEVPQEAAEDLLKKLLECNNQQVPQDTDWASNTNEFISIDRLAHICTVCHKSFSDGIGLFEHKRLTGHDLNNSMQPPPPPNKNHMGINMNQLVGPRHLLHSQHLQMGSNPNYLSRTLSPHSQISAQHPQHPQHPQHLQHPQHPQLSSQHPSQHPSHAQLAAMGIRPGYPGPGYSSQAQQRYPVLPPNYVQSPQMVPRRPPPLYRAPNSQNAPPGTPPFNDLGIGQDIFYPPNSSRMMNGPMSSTGPYSNGQIPNMATRPPVFLKARLQRAIRPKSQSPNGSPSPPIVMSPQQITRPKFLGPLFNGPQLNSSQLNNTQHNKQHLDSTHQAINGNQYGAPPLKKIKREPDDCEVIVTQPRTDGLPIIQSVHGGTSVPTLSLQDSLEKSKESLQLNDQITLSLKNKEKNPKEVANLLANRGITVTHKPKNGVGQEETNKNALAQEAVQKLQLNNSVSIISKKKNESNSSSSSSSSNSSNNGNDDSNKSSPSSSSKIADSPFISCPIPDCEEKFLTQESLNRHTQRGHRMNKMNLKAFRCKVCPAMFSTQEGLVDHQRRNHRIMKTSADELGIPVIDLKNEQTKQKLAALGIINYIPLSSKGANGCFGFPIVSVQGAANPNVCNVLGMGINSLLSLGPIKPIPTKKE